MTEFPYSFIVPEAARLAYEWALSGGFGEDGPNSSSRPGTGSLLAVLAASKPAARIAELGTGLGAGSAWIATGMDANSKLVTVEVDPERAQFARSVLGRDSRIEMLQGSWEEILPARGPFDLVFVDSGYSSQLSSESAANFLLEIAKVGGLLVLDDVTPQVALGGTDPDPKRDFVYRNARVIGAELYPPANDGTLGGPQSGLLVATRIR
jgi:predicted O-methyltransferase YrrM